MAQSHAVIKQESINHLRLEFQEGFEPLKGYPEGVIRGCARRFLLPILSGTKEGRGTPSHPRSEKPQQVSQTTQVQDGDFRVHSSSSEARRLVCGPGPKRRIFPCHHTQEPQEISAPTLQQHHFSVCGLTLRPFHSTQDFHQVHGSRGSIPAPPGDPGVSLHRRLADCLDLKTSGLRGHSVCSPDVTITRSYRESRKVQAESISSGGLHRSEARLSARSDVHASRTHQKVTQSHNEIQAKGKSKSKPCATSARPHGFYNGDLVPCSPQDAFTSNLAAVPLRSTPRQSKQASYCHPGAGTTASVVDFPTSPLGGTSLPSSSFDNSSHYGRESTRMGRPLPGASDQRPVVPSGEGLAHQPPGAASHHKGFEVLPTFSERQGDSARHRQHHSDVLCEQAGRNKIKVPFVPVDTSLGVVLPGANLPGSHPHSHHRQHRCRRAQSPSHSKSRMGTGLRDLSGTLPQVGNSDNRHVRQPLQQEMSPLRIQGRTGPRIIGRCFHDPLAQGPSLPVSSHSIGSEVSSQSPPVASRSNLDCTLVAQTTLVLSTSADSNRQGQASSHSSPNNSGLGVDLPSRPRLPPIDSVEDIPSIMEVLDKARKPSTIRLYQHKWQGFLKFATERGLQASPVSLSTLLLYLRHLFDLGLSKSTLKIYTSAIVTFQPKGSQSSRWFSHPTVKAFFRGLTNMRPPVRRPLPQWSLQTVLHSLVRPPFEPMATCDLKFLSLKTLFLVAITSARRASELAALRADSPYLQFFKDKVVLHPDISFLPKVVSDFHVNQPLLLPTLFSEPSSDVERTLHCLDVRRALSFYISRTKDFRKVQRLFLCYYGQRKGTAASTSTLSRWLVSTISLAYELQHKPLPENLRAHSTRAVATSTALLRGVDIPDICRAATWSSVSTFIKHYRLDLRAKNETRFGRAILTSLLQ
uniref:Uncharacterized protein n=1 Tax=Pogona vitticeps TaxID=103695 RepID=A0ABM5G4K6_9SAUR